MESGKAARLTFLAIDNESLPLRRNLCLYLSKPTVRAEPVLLPEHGNPDAPDNAAAHFYGGVVRANGKYRMWYYACHWDPDRKGGDPLCPGLIEGPVCYAESEDGIRWVKPKLGQVEWRGSRANNVIRLATAYNEGVHVIKDDADPDPARRYKMVYNDWAADRKFWTIRTAVSPDGVVWTDGPRLPYDAFLEQASLYRFGDFYYVSGQMFQPSEGGHGSGRQGFAILSPDFNRWLPECGESFLLPEPADPVARGAAKPYEQVHIGVGAASFGNVLVGLYCLWHNHPEKDWFGTGTTSGDFGLLVSNDGLHFREPVKGHVWLHRDDSPPALAAHVKHSRILCQGNGILNAGDETRIYHGRWANTVDVNDYTAEVALATLPRDRWGALGLAPDAAEGSVWTAPVTVQAGGALRLNAEGAAAIRVEAADERFHLIPACSGASAGRVRNGDGLDCPVVWPDNALAVLPNRTVRFRLTMTSSSPVPPRLYALYVDEQEAGAKTLRTDVAGTGKTA